MIGLRARAVRSVGTVRVVPVEDAATDRAFRDFPYRLYAGDPRWVPPLRRDERNRWSVRHNASLRSRWVRRFLVRRGERVVGRIAALVDQPFASRWAPATGLFGFFECADDQQAASALLAAAEHALRERDMEKLIGPVNLTTHDETGILIEGFDSPPMVQSPYNPAYYERLVEEAGYRACRDYHAYLWTPSHEAGPAVRRLVGGAARGEGIARGVRIRPLEMRRWDAEIRTFFDLYNASFRDVWGFVPIGWDEFVERATRFRPFVVPDLALLAEEQGKPVGFALTLPDINEALLHLGGRLWPLGWLQLARRLPRIRSARFILLGVCPEWTGRGIGALLAFETGVALRRLEFTRVELSLVQATNQSVRRVIEAFGCPSVKTFRLYAKTLTT